MFQLTFRKNTQYIPCATDEKDLFSAKSTKASVWDGRGFKPVACMHLTVHSADVGTINAENQTLEFWRDLCDHQGGCLSSEVCGYFRRTTSDFAQLKTLWLQLPACKPDLSAVENVQHIVKTRIRWQHQRTAELLQYCIQQKLTQIHLAKLHQFVSWGSTWLKSIIKGRFMKQSGKNIPLSQLFWVGCCCQLFTFFSIQ